LKTVLILTVGGSHQPILTAIEQHQPHRIYFLCSADVGKAKGSYTQVIGEGKVLKSKHDVDKPDLPNIATLARLSPEQFEIHQIVRFDDLNDCYLDAMKVIEKARRDCPDARLLADYTGGTKSMTAGLTAAALDDGQCEISLVAGRRDDLVRVSDQTQFVRPVQVWDAQALRRLKAARELAARYDYAAAEKLLRAAAAQFASERTLAILQRGIGLCRAFDAWDRFEHATARDLLRPYQGEFVPYWRFLGYLLKEKQGHGFEWVEDLLRNAERRAAQGRYDDAVGRLYRAIELTAQLWLELQHQLRTDDIDLAAVPESKRAALERYRDDEDGKQGTIKIGLWAAWGLIAAFPGDPLGERFGKSQNALLDFLTVRNASLFAHGYRPVSSGDYQRHMPAVAAFLGDCVAAAAKARNLPRLVVLEQLPTTFL
jgi:CRISPR-associated protein (Cas_Cas02710)